MESIPAPAAGPSGALASPAPTLMPADVAETTMSPSPGIESETGSQVPAETNGESMESSGNGPTQALSINPETDSLLVALPFVASPLVALPFVALPEIAAQGNLPRPTFVSLMELNPPQLSQVGQQLPTVAPSDGTPGNPSVGNSSATLHAPLSAPLVSPSAAEFRQKLSLATGLSLEGLQSKTTAVAPAVPVHPASQLAKSPMDSGSAGSGIENRPLVNAVQNTAVQNTAIQNNAAQENIVETNGAQNGSAAGKDLQPSPPVSGTSGSHQDASSHAAPVAAAPAAGTQPASAPAGSPPSGSAQFGSAQSGSQSVSLQPSSLQTAAVPLVDPVLQRTSGQPAISGSQPKSEDAGQDASSDSPLNHPSTLFPASELPPAAATSPVQMAQMVSKAAQAEMRIGLNTSAFGSVEVRTTVHANDVGVSIGSEKGDLRSLLANELPGIANTLQQQNLRLSQVSFQQGTAFSGNFSSGGDSQPRSFVSPQPSHSLALSETSSDDPLASLDAVSSAGMGPGNGWTSLSILA